MRGFKFPLLAALIIVSLTAQPALPREFNTIKSILTKLVESEKSLPKAKASFSYVAADEAFNRQMYASMKADIPTITVKFPKEPVVSPKDMGENADFWLTLVRSNDGQVFQCPNPSAGFWSFVLPLLVELIVPKVVEEISKYRVNNAASNYYAVVWGAADGIPSKQNQRQPGLKTVSKIEFRLKGDNDEQPRPCPSRVK